MHHMQLKVELPTHVVRLLPELRICDIGLECGSEQRRPRPGDIETGGPEGFEPPWRNTPFEHALDHRFALQRVDLETRHAPKFAVTLCAAIGTTVDPVITEAAEIEVRKRIVA